MAIKKGRIVEDKGPFLFSILDSRTGKLSGVQDTEKRAFRQARKLARTKKRSFEVIDTLRGFEFRKSKMRSVI